jgi:hypothetical protein
MPFARVVPSGHCARVLEADAVVVGGVPEAEAMVVGGSEVKAEVVGGYDGS